MDFKTLRIYSGGRRFVLGHSDMLALVCVHLILTNMCR